MLESEGSHSKIADDGIIKGEIIRILFNGPISRKELRYELRKMGLNITRKDIDYHLRREKKGIINEGIVQDEERQLSIIINPESLVKIIGFLSKDPVAKTWINKELSYAYWRSLLHIDLNNNLRIKKASDNAKNDTVEDIGEVIGTILLAYEYDMFLDETLSKIKALPSFILTFDRLSPTSHLFEGLRHTYQDKAIQEIADSLIIPALNGRYGNLNIFETREKSDLLNRLFSAERVLWYIKNTHIDKVQVLAKKAERLAKATWKNRIPYRQY